MVLDTSVIVKWIETSSEPDAKKALVFYEKFRHGEIEIAIPDLALFELANYASRQDINSFQNCQKLIELIFLSDIQIIPPDHKMIQDAAIMAKKLKITAYDAIFLILAKNLNSKVVTADKKLAHLVPELATNL